MQWRTLLELSKSVFPNVYDQISITFNDKSIEFVALKAHFQKCCTVTSTSLSSPETNLKQVMKMAARPKMEPQI